MELKSIGGHEKGRLRADMELPIHQEHFDPKWKHLNGMTLADPDFGMPGKVDMLIIAYVYC